jgi:hypothetical protein
MSERRFPPWFIEDIGGYFVVKASNGRPLVFISYGDGVAGRSLARLLTRDAKAAVVSAKEAGHEPAGSAVGCASACKSCGHSHPSMSRSAE